MGRKRYTSEEIISMLREAEVFLNQGSTVGEICHEHKKKIPINS